MRTICAIMISSILWLVCGCPSPAVAAPHSQEPRPLDVTLVAVQRDIVQGEAITWLITLEPRGQLNINQVELLSGDARVWAWPNAVRSIQALSSTIVLNVSAVALVAGDLQPAVIVNCTADGQPNTLAVVSADVVHVQPVESHVIASILHQQGTANQNEQAPLELWISNRTPFVLTQLQLQQHGVDLEWGYFPSVADISSGVTRRIPLTPTVTGANPQPRLSLEYVWTDVTQSRHSQSLDINGPALKLEEGIISRIPSQVLGILVGLVAGILTTFGTTLVGSWLSRRLAKGVNRRHVRGLLRLMVMQSEYAAANGVKMELGPLETLFKEEALFAVMQDDKLNQTVHELWWAGTRHNDGLSQTGGARRSEELRHAGQELNRQLEALEHSKTEQILHGLLGIFQRSKTDSGH